jgi:hypothetical protein
LQENLPLGQSSRETEIVNITAFTDRDSNQVAAWLYTSREGKTYLQVRQGFKREIVAELERLGDSLFARLVDENGERSYIPVPKSVALEQQLRRAKLLAECLTHPLR